MNIKFTQELLSVDPSIPDLTEMSSVVYMQARHSVCFTFYFLCKEVGRKC